MSHDYRSRIYNIRAAGGGPQLDLAYTDRLYAKQFGHLLPADRTAAILEVGCGWGSFVHFMRSRGYANAVGVEQGEQSLALAKKHGVAGVSRGDALETLRSRPAAYDCIVANDFLEHFRKDELLNLLDLIKGALKPGGSLIGRTPNADGFGWGRIRYGDLTHELAFTRHSLGQAVAAAGFAGLEAYPEEPVATGLRSAARWLLWKPMNALLKLYLFAESYSHEGAILTPNLIFRARLP